MLEKRQPTAPANAAKSHWIVGVHLFWSLKKNKTTAPETGLDGPEQVSLADAFRSRCYQELISYSVCNSLT